MSDRESFLTQVSGVSLHDGVLVCALCMCVCVCVFQQSTSVISGLLDTVDKVIGHMVSNLEDEPSSLLSIDGKSYVAGQWQHTHTHIQLLLSWVTLY